jgi:trehalose 6-phosphate phosphatase
MLPSPPWNLLTQATLFLDFDGTLVELASRPDAVKVEERLNNLLARLSEKLGGRLAIISGRAAGQILTLFGQPTFAIAGSHGLEMHWPDGRVVTPASSDRHNAILTEMRQLQQRFPGLFVEDKPFSVALHYRLAPHAENECIRLASRLACETGYQLQTGKKVVEVRLAGADKGDAVTAFMSAPPMAGTMPVFVGDDETDEAGFIAVLNFGGAGVLVGPQRQTAATFALANVEDTLLWLEAAGAAL